MIDPKDILKAAKAVVRADNGYQERRLIHPKREWLMGLAVFAVLLLIASVWAAWLYNSYQDIKVVVSTDRESVPTLQTTMIDEVLEYYRQREDRFQQFYNALPAPAPLPVATEQAATSTATTSEESELSAPELVL